MSENEPITNGGTVPADDSVITQRNTSQDYELPFNILTKALPFAFLFIIFGYYAATTDRFTDSRNIEIMMLQAAIVGFIAVGINAVMLYGELDFSAIGLVGLCSYVFVETINGGSGFGATVLAILVAGGFGVLHGLLVGGLRINSAMTTLATALVTTGLVLQASDGRPTVIESDGPGIFTETIGSISLMLIGLIFLVMILDGLRFTLKMMLADNLPQLPGWVWTLMILLLAYTFSGIMLGIGSAMFTTRIRTTSIGGAGLSQLYPAVAAVVIGGTVPGGKFRWFTGTVAAAIGIAALTNGLVLRGSDPFLQNLYVGGLLILWLCIHAGIKLIVDYNSKPVTQDS